MRFSSILSSVLEQFRAPNGWQVVPFITGKPGGGKSACAREVAQQLALELGIPPTRIIEFNPSLREPCDILGLPQMKGDHCEWLPPDEFYQIREGVGPSILIVEELTDAPMDMQNPMCRVILDRYAGQMKLTTPLYIIATGNRTEDRSGAFRLSTKLSNRMRTLTFQESIEDWTTWAQSQNVDSVLVGFLNFRPNLLSDFDPQRDVNPTPRSWEDVSRIPTTLDEVVYFEHVAGAVGQGAAAEYVGFRKVYLSLPKFEDIIASPKKASIPEEPSAKYAMVTYLAEHLDKDNAGAIADYIKRFDPEYTYLCLKGLKNLNPSCLRHPKLARLYGSLGSNLL